MQDLMYNYYLVDDAEIVASKISTCLTFTNKKEDPSLGDVIVDTNGVVKVFLGSKWETIEGYPEKESEDCKIIDMSCKHCGSSQFTKIKPKTYKCDYCDSMVLFE